MPTIIQQLGFNRAGSNIFSVGENLELHIAYAATTAHAWDLTKDGKPTKPDETERAGTSSPFTLKFKFKDGKTSDTGVYVFTVKEGSATAKSSFEAVCKNSAPQIKLPPRVALYDTTKPVDVKLNVKGVVDEYQWFFWGGAEGHEELRVAADLYDNSNSKKFTIANAVPLNGAVAGCQALNYYDGTDGDFIDAIAYTGVFGKPADKIKLAEKLPTQITPTAGIATVEINIKSKEPLPMGGRIEVFIFANGGDDYASFENTEMNHVLIGKDYCTTASANLAVLGTGKMDVFVCFHQTGQVLNAGSVEVVGLPVIQTSYIHGSTPPLNVKAGDELRASVTSVRGTMPVTIGWYYTIDNQRSWQQVGSGEMVRFKPTANGILSCIAQNKCGSSMPSVHGVSVTGVAAGTTKKPGVR